MSNNTIELPESYQKARKVFIFVSGLLLAWEFVGISIGTVSNEGVEVSIKSPEALPFFLLITVFYFGFRLFLEWKYLSVEIRKSQYVRIDYFFSNIFGLLSIVVYCYQAYFGNQVYDILATSESLAAPTTIFLISIVGSIFLFFKIKSINVNIWELLSDNKSLYIFPVYCTILYLILIIFFRDSFIASISYMLLVVAYLVMGIQTLKSNKVE